MGPWWSSGLEHQLYIPITARGFESCTQHLFSKFVRKQRTVKNSWVRASSQLTTRGDRTSTRRIRNMHGVIVLHMLYNNDLFKQDSWLSTIRRDEKKSLSLSLCRVSNAAHSIGDEKKKDEHTSNRKCRR